MTPDRLPRPLCGARRRQGEEGATCRRPAGWGTDHVGVGTCKLHAGVMRTNSQAAKKIIAGRAAEIWGIPRHIDPAEGLMEEYWRSAGIVLALERVVRQLRNDELTFGVVEVRQEGLNGGTSSTHSQDPGQVNGSDTTQSRKAVEAPETVVRKVAPNIWLKLFNEERDRWTKLGIDIVRLGLEARRDEYVRAQVDVFAAVLLDPAMELTMGQRQTAARLLRGLGAKADVIEGQIV